MGRRSPSNAFMTATLNPKHTKQEYTTKPSCNCEDPISDPEGFRDSGLDVGFRGPLNIILYLLELAGTCRRRYNRKS